MICCYCTYQGTERQVRSHMASKHSTLLAFAKRARHGRLPKNACPLCYMVHDPVARPGWAIRRSKLERPRMAVLTGQLPAGPAGRKAIIGRTVLPPGAHRIKSIWVYAEGPGRFRLEVKKADTGEVRNVYFDHPGPGRRAKEGT